jgi:hypothetical protein
VLGPTSTLEQTTLARRSRLLFITVSLLALCAAVLSACGGGSGGANDKNATQLLNTAFKQSIKSADVNFNLQIQVNGVQSLKAPISLRFAGPYASNGPHRLPSMDLNASIVGGGQSVPLGITSTGDDLFLKVQGQTYDVGKQTVARLNQQLAQQKTSNQQTSLSALGIHPSTWLTGASTVGDSTVAGAAVTHVSGSLDVGKVLEDLNQLIRRAPTSGLSGAKPPQLSASQKSQIEKVLKNPQIDVYVAKGDHTIRRLAMTLEVSIPKDQQARFNGATGGTLQLSIEFANVGQAKTIKAPSGAKPIGDLAGQLNALGGALGAAGGSSGSGSSSGSASTPTSKQFQDYAKCIQKAGGSNAAALQKCADILK